jgi:hypothetical protein
MHSPISTVSTNRQLPFLSSLSRISAFQINLAKMINFMIINFKILTSFGWHARLKIGALNERYQL